MGTADYHHLFVCQVFIFFSLFAIRVIFEDHLVVGLLQLLHISTHSIMHRQSPALEPTEMGGISWPTVSPLAAATAAANDFLGDHLAC